MKEEDYNQHFVVVIVIKYNNKNKSDESYKTNYRKSRVSRTFDLCGH